ncbi:MAG: type I restriction enzyme HsdR N-terminal domain-containing protein [Gemmatimonadales bacterium]
MTIRVSKRFLDRAKTHLRRYQKILESARARDVNESDTVVIVSDFLADVLGYDKYADLTTEFCIRSTFCDLAIKLDGQIRFLIEVKSIGTDLRENHLRQAVDYAAKQGTEWIILTNGVEWQAHRVRFEQPIQNDEVFRIDLLDPTAKQVALLNRLSLISKESLVGAEIAKYLTRKEAMSRFVVGQLLLSDPVLGAIRREVRRLSPGLKVTPAEIQGLLEGEVLKREVLEGERAASAKTFIRRGQRRQRRPSEQVSPVAVAAEASPPAVTLQ